MTPWFTNKKTGKPFRVGNSSYGRSSGVSSESFKESTITLRDYNKLLAQKVKMYHPEPQPTDDNWNKQFAHTKNYSFNFAKKDGILDYYIQVNHNGKQFYSIPLKPLIQRGISTGLSTITGFPVDVEAISPMIQKGINFYKLNNFMDLG